MIFLKIRAAFWFVSEFEWASLRKQPQAASFMEQSQNFLILRKKNLKLLYGTLPNCTSVLAIFPLHS